jgi:hypothetical protein
LAADQVTSDAKTGARLAPSELTRLAHGDPNLVEAARTTVFHDGFAAAVFALLA